MFYGLDVHKRFIQVCRLDGEGKKRGEFRVAATTEAITAFAEGLSHDDHVVLEATFHTWQICSLLRPHVARVVVANSMQVKAIAHARVKTDKLDAHILAQLLRVDLIPEVKLPDQETWQLRQLVAHRRFLGKRLVAVKNTIRGIINKKLLTCPFVELLSPSGRSWLGEQTFDETEQFILDSSLSLLDQLQERVCAVDDKLRAQAQLKQQAKLLMTIPGVNVTVAIGLLSAIGDIARFPTPARLSSYFGLTPSTYQSGDTCYNGRLTKQGRSHARWLAVEAAQAIANSNVPLAAAYHRVRRKKGHNVAVSALARKLVVLVWHMLRNNEPYRYAPIPRTRQKLRRLTPDAPRVGRGKVPSTLEAVCAEAGIPAPSPPRKAEKRAAASNRRTITRLKKTHRASDEKSSKSQGHQQHC